MKIVEGERGVRQAEAEGIGGGGAARVVPPGADQHAFLVRLVLQDTGILLEIAGRGDVFGMRRKRRRQPAAGIDVAEQHAGDRGSALLPGVPGLEQRGDFVPPGREHRCAGLEHDDRVRVCPSDLVDQLVLQAERELQIHPVVALRQPDAWAVERHAGLVAALGLGVMGEHDRDVGLCGMLRRKLRHEPGIPAHLDAGTDTGADGIERRDDLEG